jgi:phosphatidyl-myo-inositol dimannoside synthase
MPSLLFITRTWEGLGGLQSFSRALWDGWKVRYGQNAELVALERRGAIRSLAFGLKAVRQGIAAARAGKHIHLGDASLAPVAFLIRRFTRARISANACGLDLTYPPRWYQVLLRKTWGSIDVFCCNSRATAEVLCAKGWKGEMMVIPCIAEDTVPRTHVPSEPTLLLFGRLVPRKGTVWFVREVLPRLHRQVPAVRCIIAGDGPEEDAVRTAIADAGLSSCVIFVGSVSDTEKDGLLRAASMLVMPNMHREGDMEGFGIVCLEASARGVPVAAARLEGLKDSVIDGATGRFFTSGDAADCAAVIERMLKEAWDPAAVHAATLQRFSRERVLSLYDHVFT